jgi:hypothetical protein
MGKNKADMPNNFVETEPTKESCWRAIILMGRNVASYKFALAKSLIELKDKEKTFISLDELAKPFAKNLCDHLKTSPKQITSQSSKFLNTCGKFNKGEINEAELFEATTRLGFVNVINAFHVVGREDTPIKFFADDRNSNGGITLTDQFFELSESRQFLNFPQEVEARWRLVETAWELNVSASLINVAYDSAGKLLYVPGGNLGRIDVTSAKDALNGYQKGKCFYCFDDISIERKAPNLGDVDHFFPHLLKFHAVIDNLDGVWNLVLACKSCNRGEKGKFDRIPSLKYLNRLNTRNNFLISSHHPLRETLILQTGESDAQRVKFLNSCFNEAKSILIQTWEPSNENPPAF